MPTYNGGNEIRALRNGDPTMTPHTSRPRGPYQKGIQLPEGVVWGDLTETEKQSYLAAAGRPRNPYADPTYKAEQKVRLDPVVAPLLTPEILQATHTLEVSDVGCLCHETGAPQCPLAEVAPGIIAAEAPTLSVSPQEGVPIAIRMGCPDDRILAVLMHYGERLGEPVPWSTSQLAELCGLDVEEARDALEDLQKDGLIHPWSVQVPGRPWAYVTGWALSDVFLRGLPSIEDMDACYQILEDRGLLEPQKIGGSLGGASQPEAQA